MGGYLVMVPMAGMYVVCSDNQFSSMRAFNDHLMTLFRVSGHMLLRVYMLVLQKELQLSSGLSCGFSTDWVISHCCSSRFHSLRLAISFTAWVVWKCCLLSFVNESCVFPHLTYKKWLVPDEDLRDRNVVLLQFIVLLEILNISTDITWVAVGDFACRVSTLRILQSKFHNSA